MAISQKTRSIRIEIGSLDPEKYMLLKFKGREAISELFQFELEIAAEVDAPFDFAGVLGKRVIVELGIPTAFARTFIGIISTLRQVQKTDNFIIYTAEMVPPLWLLTLKQTSFIFQQQTTKEILENRFGQLSGIQNNTVQPTKTYFPRNFCAQYRETDFDFVSRLMEDEGMWYFFDHTAGGTVEFVVSDTLSKFRDLPNEKTVRFRDQGTAGQVFDIVTNWTKSQVIQSAMVMLQDTHFQKPGERFNSTSQGVDTVTAGTVAHNLRTGNDGPFPVIDAPGAFANCRDDIDQNGGTRSDLANAFDDGQRISLTRMQAIQSQAVTIDAESTVWLLTPGYFMTLEEHFDANGDYLITGVEHDATCSIAATTESLNFKYTNKFTCQPAKMEFRPQRSTTKPYISGTQTALVVGSEGAEIDPDKFGRVKVYFHWDIDKPKHLNTSCWVRVAQFWAGKQWGAQFIPRIGDEVIVAFEEGDPDKPIIIGSVYNAENMPIYKLPDNKTQSGIKTTSSPKGSTANFNEIKFEDKKGAEFISFHAELNMMTTVENSNTISVGSTSESSGSDTKTTGLLTTTVYGDMSTMVTKGDMHETIKAGVFTREVTAGTSSTHVKGDVIETYDAKQSTTTASSQATHVKADGHFVTVDSGDAALKVSGGNRIVGVTGSYSLEASEKIVLKSGSSSIVLKSDGTIILDGVKIFIQGSTSIDATGGGAGAKWEGNKATLAGSSGVEIGDGPVKITSSAKVTVTGTPVEVNS
jgi:type VI secretion system secreted protein VgrG